MGARSDPGAGDVIGGKGPETPPRLDVRSDEGWKAEAQREKERLEKQAGAEEARRALTPPTFAGFIGELGIQALLALGLMQIEGPPGMPRPPRDLPAARYTIDLLGILQEKTRGNLSPEERAHLDELLHSLRIHYARAAQEEEAEAKKVKPPEKKIIT